MASERVDLAARLLAAAERALVHREAREAREWEGRVARRRQELPIFAARTIGDLAHGAGQGAIPDHPWFHVDPRAVTLHATDAQLGDVWLTSPVWLEVRVDELLRFEVRRTAGLSWHTRAVLACSHLSCPHPAHLSGALTHLADLGQFARDLADLHATIGESEVSL